MISPENPGIKVVSLNTEGDKHLDKIFPFLVEENPHIVCLQEVLGKDVSRIQDTLKMQGEYFPSMKVCSEHFMRQAQSTTWGLLTLTNLNIQRIAPHYYFGSPEYLPDQANDNPNLNNRALMVAEVSHENNTFRVINTHFTWSANGQPTPFQHQNLDRVLEILDRFDEFVLCGDFNAPRGGEIWDRLASRYTDNIPPETITTIDQNLHRVNGLQYVVDGLFTTPLYKVNKLNVVGGISDHQAVVATISKT